MKILATRFMTRAGLALLGLSCAAAAAWGQDGRLQIGNLGALEARATDVTDVTVDERMLKLGSTILSSQRAGDAAKVKELLAMLKGVYVKVLEFEDANAYTMAELDGLRAQLQAPGWSRIVNVRSKRGGDNVEVYLLGEVDRVQGLAVIAGEPHQLVIVNVVGPIDLEKIGELEGSFGIPEIGLKLDLGRRRY